MDHIVDHFYTVDPDQNRKPVPAHPEYPELMERFIAVQTEVEQLRERMARLLDKQEKMEWKLDEFHDVIIPLGVELSAEKNINRLLNKILKGAKGICNSDGGTIYIKEKDRLYFKIILNDSLNIVWEDSQDTLHSFPPIILFDEMSGEYNRNNVASLVATEGTTSNIKDAYDDKDFDFSGTKSFDRKNNYRSTSFLTIPLKNHANDVIGVLQLINAIDPASGKIIAFSEEKQEIIESLSSLAAVAIDNQMLLEGHKNLMDAIIKLISDAIDQKSPYTGGHCQRIPLITNMLAKAVHDETEGMFRDFRLSEDDFYEINIAAWLHDIGKITTPEYVVDKATKLQTIYDRIETVKTRLLVVKRDVEIAMLRQKLQAGADVQQLDAEFARQMARLDDSLEFLQRINIGAEFMRAEDKEHVKEIAAMKWVDHDGEEKPFLNENEILNLCIDRGTLTDDERQVINNHIVVTIAMLERLPFPKHLKRVVEYAGGHHEKMDGTGYPKGLRKEQMSIPARIIAIADIFEALTASDRPYKKGKKLSEAIRIMSHMVKSNHIDGDLFKIFLKNNLHMDYAKKVLAPSQVDEFDLKPFMD